MQTNAVQQTVQQHGQARQVAQLAQEPQQRVKHQHIRHHIHQGNLQPVRQNAEVLLAPVTQQKVIQRVSLQESKHFLQEREIIIIVQRLQQADDKFAHVHNDIQRQEQHPKRNQQPADRVGRPCLQFFGKAGVFVADFLHAADDFADEAPFLFRGGGDS